MPSNSLRRAALALSVLVALGACDGGASTDPAATTQATRRRKRRRRPPPASTSTASTRRCSRATTSTQYANGAWRARPPRFPSDRSSTGTFFEVFQKAEKRNAELIQGLAAGQPGRRHRRAPHRRLLRRLHGRGRDRATRPRAAAAGARQDRRDRQRHRTVARARRRACAPTSIRSTPPTPPPSTCSACSSRRAWRTRRTTSPTCCRAASACPTATTTCPTSRKWRRSRGKYQAYVAAHADAGRHRRRRRPRPRRSTRWRRRSPRRMPRSSRAEDVHKANNPWPIADFAKKAPGLDWAAFFDAAGLGRPADGRSSGSQARSRKLSALVASEPLQAWKDYLHVPRDQPQRRILPKAFADLQLRLLRHDADRHRRAARPLEARRRAVTDGALGDAVGQLYVKQYFPASSQAKVAADGRQHPRGVRGAHRQARLDERRRPRQAPRRRRRRSASASAIRTRGATTRRSRSARRRARQSPARASSLEYRHQLAKLGKPVDRRRMVDDAADGQRGATCRCRTR